MKLWRMMLISLCLLVSACTSTRDFYEAVYSSLQFHAKTENQRDNTPYLDRPLSYQQYQAERATLLVSRNK